MQNNQEMLMREIGAVQDRLLELGFKSGIFQLGSLYFSNKNQTFYINFYPHACQAWDGCSKFNYKYADPKWQNKLIEQVKLLIGSNNE